MNISNNILKKKLENVLWICGTACGGKTTSAKLLADKYGMYHYNADEMFNHYRELAEPESQPAICRKFSGPDDYYGQSIEAYIDYLKQLNHEMFDMMLTDLLALSSDERIVVEGHNIIEKVMEITSLDSVVFLSATHDLIESDYINRPDHSDSREYISRTVNPEKTLAHVLEVVTKYAEEQVTSATKFNLLQIERKYESTQFATLELIEKHFKLV